MSEYKDYGSVERHVLKASHLNVFEVDSERESNECNYDSADHCKGRRISRRLSRINRLWPLVFGLGLVLVVSCLMVRLLSRTQTPKNKAKAQEHTLLVRGRVSRLMS